GGTTMLLSRFIDRLGQSWPVIGFDTFAGFPPKRSVLDMYCHPDCVFPDENLVRRHVSERNIEVVTGDLVTTASRLANADIILAFMDTDNFTSASAVLDVIQDRVVTGGAIVFDHFTGRNRFRYTLGERFAAKRLLADQRYFNLHDTGVFLRQR
ncbi:MAG TPA: class I SAM-dependent methyltransferase, partial [Bryobacteraceae bacterium]|nr:class I SAM-dependent methyltransferase [Bryobacteraceae bacterium]